jgi:riboflavin kinase/FMN adenylyltransferase
MHPYNLSIDESVAATIGSFDGLHIAHMSLIEKLKREAAQRGLKTLLITFNPHPQEYFRPTQHVSYLFSPEEKKEALESLDLDYVVEIPFDQEMAELSAADFTEQWLLAKYKVHYLLTGFNHAFGQNRMGNCDWLNTHYAGQIEAEALGKVEIANQVVSSSLIRESIRNGNTELTQLLLGRPYRFSGIVEHGAELGRTIEFPTANIRWASVDKLKPADGVYAVRVMYHNALLPAVMNIGFRPTVDGKTHKIEVHILDREIDLYDAHLTVDIIKFIRGEKKFNNLDELKNQIKKDVLLAKTILNSTNG